MKLPLRIFLIAVTTALIASCAALEKPPAAVSPVWIDVRSAEEYQEQHLEDAINIEFTEILEGVVQAGIDKDSEISLYCGSGRRAGIALEVLEAAGYRNVINRGGFSDLID